MKKLMTLAVAVALTPAAFAQSAPVDPQARINQALATQNLIIDDALKQGLDKEPKIREALEQARRNILLQAWQQRQTEKITLKDEDLRAAYDKRVGQLGTTEYRLRYLVANEEKMARDAIAKLGAKKARFADLVVQYSVDPQAKQSGGLVDWTPAGAVPVEVFPAVRDLKKGQFTAQPIQAADGVWIVVQVEDIRPYQVPSFDQVKPQLSQALIQQKLVEQVEKLKKPTF